MLKCTKIGTFPSTPTYVDMNLVILAIKHPPKGGYTVINIIISLLYPRVLDLSYETEGPWSHVGPKPSSFLGGLEAY